MGFLKNLIRNAVEEGIAKGVREAVSSATEKAVAPKVEECAEQVAQSINQATDEIAVTMEAAETAPADLKALWEKNVPEFPVWCFGGEDFWFDTNEENADGTYIRWFYAENCTQEGLDLYRALLRQNGFVRKYASSDEVLYKDLGGVYVLLGTTDAFGSAPTMSLTFQRTTDRSEIEI